MRNIIQKHYGLPASATAHRPVAACPGTLGEQLQVVQIALYLADRRGLRVRDCWSDARALVLEHAAMESEK